MNNEYDNFKHFSALTGVGVQLIVPDGTPIFETEAYLAYKQTLSWLDSLIPDGLEPQTRASVVAGAIQSYRFGGRFFFYSPIGLFHFASPLIKAGRHVMTAVGGPVIMTPLDEYIAFDLKDKLPADLDRHELEQKLEAIPFVSAITANTLSEQLLVNAKYLSDPCYLGIEDTNHRYNEYLLAWFSGAPSYEAILRLANEQKRENAVKKHDRIIRSVKAYVEQNYAKKITLEDASKHVFISPSYLSKLIKTHAGHSFRHLVNMIRIAEAVRLLENTDNSLAEIAFVTGYEDHSYFTKVFKRHTGMNPSEYRTRQKR